MDSDDSFSDSLIDKSSDLINLKPLDLTNFVIKKKIGQGDFSKIYAIEERASGQKYAAKVLRGNAVREKMNFFREIETFDLISKLNSPLHNKSIGYSLKDFEGDSNPTVILEYAPNGSLDKLLDLERKSIHPHEWDDTKKLIVIYGIACGMYILHSNNIIHRDLKPGSVLLDEYLLPQICGFELSITEDEISSSFSAGILAYMAPEVIEGKEYGKPIDVYSFSMIVYEIISGRNPYIALTKGKMSQFQFASKIIKGYRPTFDEYVPESYRNLIERCWSQKPEDRPTFEEIVNFLKTDEGFRIDVDEDEFLQFVEEQENFLEEQKNKKSNEGSEDLKMQQKPKFRFKKVIIEYPETKELLVDIDPIDLSLFEKINKVGEGQFGVVYKIKDKNTSEYLAAKINIKELKFCNTNEVTNLTREINNLSKLKSPTILKFIGYNNNNFKKKLKPTIVTEFSPNSTLETIIEMQKRGLTPEKWTKTKELITVYGIVSGMSYMHKNDILHRDLKPANIFYDEYLFPKIGDLGLSKEINSITPEGMTPYQIGTPAFMSPEIINQSKYSKAGDVYAFGILLFQMISLQIPYEGFNIFQVCKFVTSGNRPPLDDSIPNCYRKLIERCLLENENERPTFEDIVNLLEEDEEFIDDEVDKNEFLDYVEYIKNEKITKAFEPVTIDLKELKRIQRNDSTLNIPFLELNQFEKIKILKRLDNFKVYAIINKETGEQCEAKISTIRITKLSQQETIHLQREVNILSKLDHPTFLKFVGYSPIDFEQQPNPVIVTEMPPNRSLQDLLNVERNEDHIEEWTDTKKLINIYGIASGMSYLHSNNVIHRNLNPESIFLDEYLLPKIGNFGLLTKIHTLASMTFQTTVGIKGKPSYSSPELLECNEYSKENDVYAFSLIVYEIMTLEIPFSNINNFNELFTKIVTQSIRPKINKDIPRCYCQLIEMCWSQNPTERPSFEEITSLLKNDKDFITEEVNQEEFYEYVEFIEKSKKEFYSDNRVVKFDDIIQNKDKDKTKTKTKNKEEKEKPKSKSKIANDDDDFMSNSSKELIKSERKKVINEFDHFYDDLLNKKFIGSISKKFNVYLLQNSENISSTPFSTDHKVIIGKSTADNDFIIIKILDENHINESKFDKIKSDYQLINELKHPNIIKALGFYQCNFAKEEERPTILFEYYSRKIINVIESIEDIYLITLIYEIANAMFKIHSKKLIHRNLNLDNIYVDSSNHAKITGFCDCNLMSISEQINNSKEKPFFMSRELLMNEKYDEKVDVFSFGNIMEFILLRGKGPFLKKEDILEGHKVKIPKSINKVSYSIILKCLSHSSSERPSFKAIISTIKKYKFKLIDGIDEQIPLIEKHLEKIIDKKHSK